MNTAKRKKELLLPKQAKKKVTVFWDGVPMIFGRGFTRPRKNPWQLIRELNEGISELKEYHNNFKTDKK